jgi:hypothetical protein
LGPSTFAHQARNGAATLFGSRHQSINTLSVIGYHGRLHLLVVPPDTDSTVAYSAVMTAASANNHSTPDDLLGIGAKEATDRRQALIAQQRWESDGGAVRRPRKQYHDHAEATGGSGMGVMHPVTTSPLSTPQVPSRRVVGPRKCSVKRVALARESSAD